MKKCFSAVLLVLMLGLTTEGAAAASPTDVLKGPLDQAVLILKDPKYQNDDPGLKAEQRDKIWGIVDDTFDFAEISRRALARNWKTFSAAEQEEFAAVFFPDAGQYLRGAHPKRICRPADRIYR